MDFKTVWRLHTPPSTTTPDFRLLAQTDRTISSKIVEVDRAVPVHVPVTLVGLPQAWTAVHPFHKDAQLITVQMRRIRDNGNDGQRKILVLL